MPKKQIEPPTTDALPETPITHAMRIFRQRLLLVLGLVFTESTAEELAESIRFSPVSMEAETSLGENAGTLRVRLNTTLNQLELSGDWPIYHESMLVPLDGPGKMAVAFGKSDQEVATFISETWLPYYEEAYSHQSDRVVELTRLSRAKTKTLDALAESLGLKDLVPEVGARCSFGSSFEGIVTHVHAEPNEHRPELVEVTITGLDLELAKKVLTAIRPAKKGGK